MAAPHVSGGIALLADYFDGQLGNTEILQRLFTTAHAQNGIFTHCSGTGVGGGTVLGLSKLLLDTSDPKEIASLAEKGNKSQVDLILEDVVSGPIGQLPPSVEEVIPT